VECRCCVCVGVLSWCAQLWVSPHQFSAKQDGGVGGMSLLCVRGCAKLVCSVAGVASPIFCQAGRRCGWNVVAACAWVC
jgi:hypothetical protein